MGKQLVNSMIVKMKKSGMVTQVTPWLNEQGLEVRYVGCKPKGWEDIFSATNNVLCKFVVSGSVDSVEIFLANQPPFVLLAKVKLTSSSKWELVLGELKRQLNKDKQEHIQGKAKVGNLYQQMLGQVKK